MATKAKAKAKAKKSVKKSAGAKKALKPAAKRKTAPKSAAPKAPPSPGRASSAGTSLMTSDVAGAKAFYSGLFGWRPQDKPMPDMTYTVLHRGTDQAAGLMQHPMPGAPPAWLSYVHVDNVDTSAAKIPGLGGKIVVPPMDIPGIGRFAVATDPQGASFAIFTPKMA